MEPGIEEEQDEPGRNGEEAPVQQNQEEPEQQPIQPEVEGEADKERETVLPVGVVRGDIRVEHYKVVVVYG